MPYYQATEENMADYSTLSDKELESKVKLWSIAQTIVLVLFAVGFVCWLLVDSLRSNPMIFILLFGFVSMFILFVGQGPRQMAAELKQRQAE